MRELEEEMQRIEEVKRKIGEEEWSEEGKKMKEVVTEKMRGVWRMKERAGEEEKEGQSDHLFQVQAKSSTLRIFCIPKKELKTYELDFTFFY